MSLNRTLIFSIKFLQVARLTLEYCALEFYWYCEWSLTIYYISWVLTDEVEETTDF